MRVSVDKDELENLINKGLSLRDISKELNISYATINRLCNRFNFKSKFNELKGEILNCIECKGEFRGYIKEERKFCSRSCSITHNNKNRILKEDTKIKISNTLKLKNKLKVKEPKVRNCRNCENIISRKYNVICDECKETYYKYYRPLAEFDFDIEIFKDKFNLELVNKYGWYSPSNKGNNLNGVSKDHLYSVKDGFINKIDINIIKHPANCELMIHKENNSKNSKSSITLEELLNRIENWYSV